MSVIETEKATDVIVEYFDLICDTDYAFDETEILRRMNANAIDAVPVIRCKDCKHRYNGKDDSPCELLNMPLGLSEDFYCMFAEPKEEEK